MKIVSSSVNVLFMIRTRRLIVLILLICLLISGYTLLKCSSSSLRTDVNRVLILKESNGKRTPVHSTINPDEIHLSYICDEQTSSNLRSYCLKLPVPLNGWTHATRYEETDIAFLISISHSGFLKAMHETWLARVTHKYILNETSSTWLLANQTTKRLSSIEILLHSLKIIFNQDKQSHKSYKWFYFGGDRTYINIDHLLKRLEDYDHTRPLFLGNPSSRQTTCKNRQGRKHSVNYSSINTGVILSSKLVQLMISQPAEQNTGDVDVLLACLIDRFNVKLTNMGGYWISEDQSWLEWDNQQEKDFDPEPNNFHVISPEEMYEIDEFYSFLHIDRLVHDQNWKELTDYTRRFSTNHYQTLRMKRNK